MVNPIQKGKRGEREAYHMLNAMIMEVMRGLGFPEDRIQAAATTVQRNQNQTAVGGSDLVNTFGLAIEIKRHENISPINSWWNQTVTAATRNGEIPVLLYRQNHGKWRCQTLMQVECPVGDGRMFRAEIDYDSFCIWFKDWVRVKLQQGESIRT